MKTISKIASECGKTYERTYRTVKNIGLVLDKEKGNMLNKYQEDLLHNALFSSGFLYTITIESKMNIPETFQEFKSRTYGRK